MISVASSFENALSAAGVLIAELYEITLSNNVTYYYTNHNKDIDWGSPSQTYTAIPITREGIKKQINLEPDIVQISLANITGDFTDVVQLNLLDGATIVIKRIQWNQAYGAGMEMKIFEGTADIDYNRDLITLTCTAYLNTLNIAFPKNMYQDPCNNTLFDAGCGLNALSWDYNGTASSTADDRFHLTDSDLLTVLSALSNDASFLNLGELRIDSGSSAGQRRMIRTVDVDNTIIYITNPFPYAVENGDSYTVFAGCDKRPETCRDRFSNEESFTGFVYIPKPEETAM